MSTTRHSCSVSAITAPLTYLLILLKGALDYLVLETLRFSRERKTWRPRLLQRWTWNVAAWILEWHRQCRHDVRGLRQRTPASRDRHRIPTKHNTLTVNNTSLNIYAPWPCTHQTLSLVMTLIKTNYMDTVSMDTTVPMFRLSTVGPSTFLDLGTGMDCPKMLFRRRHFQVSGANLNPSSSSSHILILSSNCTFDTTVVLVVMFIT